MVESQVHPVVGFSGSALVFVGVGLLLFHKTSYAPYIVLLLAGYIIASVSDRDRDSFLRGVLGRVEVLQLTAVESLMVAVPFMITLVAYQEYWFATVTWPLVWIVRLLWSRKRHVPVLPTPYGRYPFEYAVGSRKYVLVLLAAASLAVIAISVGNANLAVFSLVIVVATAVSYYGDTEHSEMVALHSMTASSFLRFKFLVLLRHYAMQHLPLVIILGAVFPQKIELLVGITLLGVGYSCLIMFMKYSTYPRQLHIPESLILLLHLVLPPLLLVGLLYYYTKATKTLQLHILC